MLYIYYSTLLSKWPVNVLVPKRESQRALLNWRKISCWMLFLGERLPKFPNQEGTFYSGHWGFFVCFFFLYFKKKFGGTVWHMGCEFPDQGSHLHPLHWKGGVLTTAPPGRPQDFSWDLTKSETWTLFPLPWGGESSPTPQACGVSSICEVSSSQLTSFYDLANLSYLVLKSAG